MWQTIHYNGPHTRRAKRRRFMRELTQAIAEFTVMTLFVLTLLLAWVAFTPQ